MNNGELKEYLETLIAECRSVFGDRLLYVGLQGSYLRGEANENSDIDVMLVLNGLSVRDMDLYRDILDKIGHADKSCGFICGREELARWNPLEICHLRHTTKDLFGTLAESLPNASREDEINFIKLSLGNLYHEFCHRYIHGDRKMNVDAFRGACKGLFFLIQNLNYLETGEFVTTKKALTEQASQEDRRVLALADLPDGFDFDAAFSLLFTWFQNAFRRIGQIENI